MKAMSPQTPSKKTAKAQFWDMVVTASGMPVPLGKETASIIRDGAVQVARALKNPENNSMRC
jgi:hypothetical protein